MKIRGKFLMLALILALAPIILAAVAYRLSMHRLRDDVSSVAYDNLTRDAKTYLQTLVGDYGRIIQRDRMIIEALLMSQAHEVEDRLASRPPSSPKLYFSRDYDEKKHLPDDMQGGEEKYSRIGPDGKPRPIDVSFEQQVYFPVRGVKRSAIAEDMARLSTMPSVYIKIYELDPKMMTWLYTSLQSGFHSAYPGHGGYPPEYDPRIREWYTEAKNAKVPGPVWTLLPDISTRTVSLTCSMSVFRPNGKFAGVTAIDVPITGILQELKLPEEWAKSSIILQTYPGEPNTEYAGKLVIIVQKSYRNRGQQWEKPVDIEYLESDDPDQMAAFMRDMAAGKSGVRQMRYHGEDTLWAYSAYRPDELLSVVIVPYGEVIAGGRRVEDMIRGMAKKAMAFFGAVVLSVAVLAIVFAVRLSRKLTRPIRHLAEAAGELASGNFNAHVEVHTKDELEELGDVFNEMGPQLLDRQKMKQSLALAMEIQQHLLPQESPKLDGFDIAGTSLYSDETGGDYYDFIDLGEPGSGKLGIAVGDITGHGIGAALLMASARAVLRSHAIHHSGDLGALFEDINRHLVRDTGESRFLTLFYCVLDAATHSMRWISGGHDAPLWLHSESGEIEELAVGDGLLLGVIEDAAYTESGPVTLGEKDIILIGTDGVWEARNPAGDMFGKERLREVIRRRSGDSASGIYEAVVAAVRDFSESIPQEDDITLVVIKAL